jgi:O-antigen/teichoic acid export membrane protein/peptidoglycan/xylan/chitin deacetylase (PgdA/CDA1 family)
MSASLALLRNIAILSIASYAELGLGLLLGVVIARSLGSQAFGHYAFAIWLCGTLVTLCNNALTMSSIKFIAEARGNSQPATAAAIADRLRRWQVLSTAIVLGVFGAAVMIHTPQEWREDIGIMLPLLLIGAWSRSGYMMLAAIGKGAERFEVESIPLILSAVLNLTLVSALAWLGASMIGFFAVFALCGLTQNLTARLLLRRFGIQSAPAPLESSLRKRIERHLLLSGVLVVVGLAGDRTIETLLLKSFWKAEAVGFFAIAGALTKGATYLLAGALSSVLLPIMARAFGGGGRLAVARLLPEAIRFYWFIGIAIAGFGVVAAPGAVRLLYGHAYEAAIPAIVVNLVISGFVLVAAAFNAFQTSSDHQADRIRVVGLALAVNVVAACGLVPWFGLAGALGSLAITRIASVYFSWRYAMQDGTARMPFLAMGRTLIAALYAVAIAEACALALPGRQLDFVVEAIGFGVSYLGASVVLGVWTQDDFDVVGQVLSRFGARGRRLGAWVHNRTTPNAVERFPVALSKRQRAAQASRSLGLSRVARSVRSRCVSDLRVLAYHRVLPDLDEQRFLFDPELVSATRSEFDWQMAYVARTGRMVSGNDVAEALDGGRPLPRGAVMVTFDDGFRDNYDVAYPVLQKHGIGATFFISTGYVGASEMFWFDWLVHAMLQTPRTAIRIEALGLDLALPPDASSRRQAAMQVLARLKRGSEEVRIAVLAGLRANLDIGSIAAADLHHAPMTWNQAREMSAGGMEFGSHTVTHPILSRISDPARLRSELTDSKLVIERELGRPVLSLAYPVGGLDAVNAEVLRQTREAGYRFAFTYESGVNPLSEATRFQMRRLRIERDTSRDMFIAAMEMPSIFA